VTKANRLTHEVEQLRRHAAQELQARLVPTEGVTGFSRNPRRTGLQPAGACRREPGGRGRSASFAGDRRAARPPTAGRRPRS
jgi:hypothetical protein